MTLDLWQFQIALEAEASYQIAWQAGITNASRRRFWFRWLRDRDRIGYRQIMPTGGIGMFLQHAKIGERDSDD